MPMRQETTVDGFRLAYERIGPGPGKAGRADVARLAGGPDRLWPERDPLFPREWSDRIGEFITAALASRPGILLFSMIMKDLLLYGVLNPSRS